MFVVQLSLVGFVLFDVAHCDEANSSQSLQVPPGYTVEVVADAPLVQHPLMADFDPQGRLYVAASAGENLRREELEKRLPNFVQRLEDVDGDGVFDRATVFADKMTFPQGCLWHAGSLFVASSGAIWKLTDNNDDGVADVREKLVGDFGYTGNAADVHGPFLGPDGRIYWCEGRHGHEIKDRDGKLISKGKAARIFSCQEDGTDVRTFCTGGMDNPVEIVFTPEGEMLGTVNLMYNRPRGDCLVHWQYGGVYPREDFAASLGAEFVRTGDLLPEVHNFGHVAVSGLCRASGNQLGWNFEGSLFITQFNTNRVVRAVLKPNGSTYAVDKLEDFAVSSSNDFHPTDVLEDADGSLLVIDTGGWFRIGCPQSQVEKSHIKGAIYRIRRSDAPKVVDPRGTAIDWQSLPRGDLLKLLGDARPVVRGRAIELLATRIRDSRKSDLTWVRQVMSNTNESERLGIFWALCRADTTASLELLSRYLAGGAIAPVHTDFGKVELNGKLFGMFLLHEFSAGDMATRRRLLNMLGVLYPDHKRLTPALLRPQSSQAGRVHGSFLLDDDRLASHARVLALIAANDRDALTQGLLHENQHLRNIAAIALEQLRRPLVNATDEDWLEIPPPAIGTPLAEEDRKQLLVAEQNLLPGDIERGRQVFAAAKTSCSKCHRIEGEGGQIGPDLSTIGRSRSQRDLLEAILFPSASFARGFAPYVIQTDDGQTVSGIILGEGAQKLRLGIDKDKSQLIANDTIEEIRASNVSIMPSDVHRSLTPQELADLVSYLKSLSGIESTLGISQ